MTPTPDELKALKAICERAQSFQTRHTITPLEIDTMASALLPFLEPVTDQEVAEIQARHERVERNIKAEQARGAKCRRTRLQRDRAILLQRQRHMATDIAVAEGQKEYWQDRAEAAEAKLADIYMSSDIQQGDVLYRKVAVVIGPGKTQDKIDKEAAEARVKELEAQIAEHVAREAVLTKLLSEVQFSAHGRRCPVCSGEPRPVGNLRDYSLSHKIDCAINTALANPSEAARKLLANQRTAGTIIADTIFAWTAPGSNYPEYVNISHKDDCVVVTVRAKANHLGQCGETVAVDVPLDAWKESALEENKGLVAQWAGMIQNAVTYNSDEDGLECRLCHQGVLVDGPSPSETGSWHRHYCPMNNPPAAAQSLLSDQAELGRIKAELAQVKRLIGQALRARVPCLSTINHDAVHKHLLQALEPYAETIQPEAGE